MSTNRKRKYGPIRPAAEASAGTNDAVFDKFFGAEASPVSQPPAETPPVASAHHAKTPAPTPDTSLPRNISLPPETPLALRGASLTPDTSLTPDAGHSLDLWAGIGELHTGYLRLYGVIIERLYRHLDPFEQAVYTQLYALSWGFGNPSCRVSWPKLAERAGMKQTAAFNAVKRLAAKGLVRKGAPTLGRGKEQGGEFWLPLPERLAEDVRLARNTRLTPNVSNKEKNKKKDIKGAVCDLCRGMSGHRYVDPDNPQRGVVKCGHGEGKG